MKLDIKETLVSQAHSRCFHAFAICDGKAYLHGGLLKYPSENVPLSNVVVFDPSTLTLSAVKSVNEGPARSHHTAVSVNNHMMCVVGGWDGKKRTTEVWFFDVVALQWSLGKPTAHSNPPAGLSSHTCTLLNPHEVVITGREGGVRTQRRYGSCFQMKFDAGKKTYTYEELPYHISSRAGHTACVISKNIDGSKGTSLVVVGGRDSKDADRFPVTSTPTNSDLGHLMHQVIKSNLVTSFHGLPIRNHAALPAGNLGVVHGGEIYGKMRENIVSDFFIHDSTASKWWKLNIPGSNEAFIRMGHSLAWLEKKIYIICGIQKQKGEASNSVIQVDFNE